MARRRRPHGLKFVAVLPYLRARGPLAFGGLVMTPVSPDTAAELLPAGFAETARWYFSRYSDEYDRVESVTLLHRPSKPLFPAYWHSRCWERLSDTVTLLAAGSLTTVAGWFLPVGETFRLFVHGIQPDRQHIVVDSGSYVRRTDLRSGHFRLVRPPYTSQWEPSESDVRANHVLPGLSNALEASPHLADEWWRRLLRSSRLYVTACCNVDSMHYFDRIVLLAAAYEALLCPGKFGTSEFVRAVQASMGLEPGPEMGWVGRFAKELYVIRSKYSHGAEMADEDYRSPVFGEYFRTGRWLYGQALRELLRTRGYAGRLEYVPRESEFRHDRHVLEEEPMT